MNETEKLCEKYFSKPKIDVISCHIISSSMFGDYLLSYRISSIYITQVADENIIFSRWYAWVPNILV